MTRAELASLANAARELKDRIAPMLVVLAADDKHRATKRGSPDSYDIGLAAAAESALREADALWALYHALDDHRITGSGRVPATA